jgi:RNase H-fold protein (predicted Holliday junction resolvase)
VEEEEIVTQKALPKKLFRENLKYPSPQHNLQNVNSSCPQHRIIIVGDSHARDCAKEVQQNVGCGFEVQEIVKPGSSTEVIVNTATRDIKKLTYKDPVVVWAGTRDVGKNDTGKGLLYQIKNFVENYKQTNIIVMSVPHRHDLEQKSRVNDEVERFNRKLKKFVKVYGNTRVIEVESDRDLFTKHGLHMNLRGKEQTAKRIGKEILDMLSEKKSDPIKIKGKDEEGTSEPREEKCLEENQENGELCGRKEGGGGQNVVEQTLMQSKRPRRLPINRSEDFLWLDLNKK